MVNYTRWALAVILLSVCICAAALAADPPHGDYRSGYNGASCFAGVAACHTYAAYTFLPEPIDLSPSTDYTEFCLSCHNPSGEAHEKPAGTSSTLVYINLTGFDPDDVYSGNSHSWEGIAKGAGTRFPTLSGFDGTFHMPNGNEITCQVCHEGMSKGGEENLDWAETSDMGDQTHFILNNYSTTKQYLEKYLRVYRTSSDTGRPTNTRSKKEYLVDPSEYFYGYSTAVLTFYASQPAGTHIYADIPQPYFRQSNIVNAICLDCHYTRGDTAVSHPHGNGTNDNHPVQVAFGPMSGLHDTLKSSPDPDVYLEDGVIMCTSCHDPHNAASDDGYNLIRAEASDVCAACHEVNGFSGITTTGFVMSHYGNKHAEPTVCLDCHTMHNTTNIMLIREVINGRRVMFQDFSGMESFGNDDGNSVCEACHTVTDYHLNSGAGSGHYTDDNCTMCHPHGTGFPDGCDICGSCHGFPPPLAPPGWNDTGLYVHELHMTHLSGASFGFLSGLDACNECHGEDGLRTDHDTEKDNAGIDTSTWESWFVVGGDWGTAAFDYGSSIGKIDTSDDTCTNVSCHASGGTRYWNTGFY